VSLTQILEAAALAALFGAQFQACARLLQQRPARWGLLFGGYRRELEQGRRALLWRHSASRVLGLQGLGLGLVVFAGGLGLPLGVALLVALGVALLPKRVLALAQRRQRRLIDAQLDGGLTTLVNALRARPSPTAALAQACPLFPAPLRAQVEFSLSQMRVGSSLEEALLDLGLRVRSQALDAAISSLLLGQKVGGRLPEILENMGITLREMARLDGVLRTKTSDARMQLQALALMPIALVLGLTAFRPQHFDPLLGSPTGMVVIVASLLLWLGSLLVARRVLAVSL
jgi:tight adherence protein B